MSTDLVQLVKAEMKGMSTFGSAPVTLQRETEALCAVVGRKFDALARDLANFKTNTSEAVMGLGEDITDVQRRIARLEPKPSRVCDHDTNWLGNLA